MQNSDNSIYISAIMLYNIFMDFYFSNVKKPKNTIPVALRTVYHVLADPSYDVIKKGGFDNDFIALRTNSGVGRVLIEGYREMTVLPGTLLFFRHNDVRHYYCSDESWHFWWFEFNPRELPGIHLNHVHNIVSVENEEYDSKACMEYLGKDNTASHFLASATFNLLLHKWMLHFENSDSNTPYKEAVNAAIDFIKANIAESITVKSVASVAGFCERRFRQIFIEITGIPPKKYIDTLRIDMASELLLNTSFSISEISDKLGYSSQFHFSRAFQAVKGVPPSLFKKRFYDIH